MKLKEIKEISSVKGAQTQLCRILSQSAGSVTFEVDENLPSPERHLLQTEGKDIISGLLFGEQIAEERCNIIASSFSDEKGLADIEGTDVLFKCFVKCYGEHRPLVLSPDAIWMVIAQTLARHINSNAEKFRDQVVRHEGQMDIIVESAQDLLLEDPDWNGILEDFYSQIDSKTKGGIAGKITADFSTTGADERIASIATLMNGVQSYFKYSVVHCICGIPSITLKGTARDWERLLEKSAVLKDFGLKTWHSYLWAILPEFVLAASGKPNRTFWKSIVCRYTPEEFHTHRGCIPEDMPVDGWFAALFPCRKGRYCYDKADAFFDMDSEMIRSGFKYVRLYPDGRTEVFPMELWSGIYGVEEDPETYAVTPKIGWFVRQSNEEQESLYRLEAADRQQGICLDIDMVPGILQKIEKFGSLTLNFRGDVSIPEWLLSKEIGRLSIWGEISEEGKALLKRSFTRCGSVCINEWLE